MLPGGRVHGQISKYLAVDPLPVDLIHVDNGVVGDCPVSRGRDDVSKQYTYSTKKEIPGVVCQMYIDFHLTAGQPVAMFLKYFMNLQKVNFILVVYLYLKFYITKLEIVCCYIFDKKKFLTRKKYLHFLTAQNFCSSYRQIWEFIWSIKKIGSSSNNNDDMTCHDMT